MTQNNLAAFPGGPSPRGDRTRHSRRSPPRRGFGSRRCSDGRPSTPLIRTRTGPWSGSSPSAGRISMSGSPKMTNRLPFPVFFRSSAMCRSAFHAGLQHRDAAELVELGGLRVVVVMRMHRSVVRFRGGGDRREVAVPRAALVLDLAGRPAMLVEDPMPARVLVRRVQDRLLEEPWRLHSLLRFTSVGRTGPVPRLQGGTILAGAASSRSPDHGPSAPLEGVAGLVAKHSARVRLRGSTLSPARSEVLYRTENPTSPRAKRGLV